MTIKTVQLSHEIYVLEYQYQPGWEWEDLSRGALKAMQSLLREYNRDKKKRFRILREKTTRTVVEEWNPRAARKAP